MKVYKVLLFVFILLISIAAVCAAEDSNSALERVNDADDVISFASDDLYAADYSVVYVNPNGGSNLNDGLSNKSALKSIDRAYNLVNSGGTIYLADGVYDKPSMGIGKSLSIIGSNNTIIDGKNKILTNTICFNINTGVHFTLKNIKFMNIKSNLGDASIILAKSGSKITLENCDFINISLKPSENINNYDSEHIGTPAIKNRGDTYIINCNFINNYTNFDSNNAFIRNLGKLNIVNTKFENANNAFIYSFKSARSDVVYLNIDNCTFINGYSSEGGAIYSNSQLNINNSLFINCRAHNGGGAVYILKNSYDKTVDMKIDNTFFEKCGVTNLLYGFGGALYIGRGVNAHLNNDTFSQSMGKGSAICTQGNTVLNNSIIKNSIIPAVTNMYVYYLGSVLNDYGNFIAVGSIFENNTCSHYDPRTKFIGTAGIYNRGSLDVTYSAFLNNKILKDTQFESIYTESGAVKSLNFNFWGGDDNPYDLSFTNYKDINNWFYLDISPEYLALDINESANIIASLKLSNPYASYDSEKLPKFNVTFSSHVNDKYLFESEDFVNNSASTIFNLTQDKGQYILLTSINSYSKPLIIDVGKNISIMDVNAEDVVYGENLIINVTVKNNNSDFLNGNITFKINNNNYVRPLINGSCNLSVSNLNPGVYPFKVTYEGDEDYFKSIRYMNASVKKIPTNLSISMPEIFYIGQKAKFNTTLSPENIKIRGYLYLNDSKPKIVYIYGGNTNISLGVLPVGEYNFTIVLWNHTYYESSSANATFKVEKYDVNFTMEVSDIMVGENTTIIITTSPADFQGYAILEVNGVNQSVFLYNNQTKITVSNLNAGRYDLKLYYEGDDKFKNTSTVNSFKVLKHDSALNITVGEGFVLINTSFKNCTGPVYLYFNDEIYSMNLTAGVANFTVSYVVGYNYIYAYYPGDDYYEYSTANTTYLVPDTPGLTGEDLIIYEHSGEGYVINLNNELGYPIVNATISVEIAGKKYSVLTNFEGYALLPLDLDVGDYVLFASYKNYNLSNDISVKPINLRVSLKNVISNNHNQSIMAKVSKGVTGRILFELSNNDSYTVEIENGIALLNISNLTVGDYSLKVFYINDIYKSNPVFANFSVIKHDSSIDVVFGDVLFDDDFIASVKLNDNATGNVSFIINGSVYVREVVDGSASLVLSSLEVGTYNLNIIYSGDSYYYSCSISNKLFNVFKYDSQINLRASDILYGENEVIEAHISKNATGNVSFTVNGSVYVREVVDGSASLDLPYLEVGQYYVDVVYEGNVHYHPIASNCSFSVFKLNTFLAVEIEDTLSGDDVVVDVLLDSGAKGSVSFVLNDFEHVVDVIASKARLILSNLSVGQYGLEINYSGDSHYCNNSTHVEFRIYKLDTFMDVVVTDVLAGNDEVISVRLNENTTGNVTFNVGGKTYVRDVSGGLASLTLSGLEAKTYDFSVSYSGDIRFNAKHMNSSFSLKTLTSGISIDVSDVKYLENVVIKVNVTKGASGNVTFTIGNILRTVELTDSKAILEVANLEAGRYEVDVKYNGDGIYLSSKASASFNVEKAESSVRVVVNSVVVGENIRLYAVVSPNASGNVTFRMLGYYSPRNKTINGNNASWLISPLNTGQYTVIAVYNGDNNYLASNTTYYLSVNQIETVLDVEINNVSKTSDIFVKASLKTTDGKNLSGQIMLTIEPYDYIIDIKDGNGLLNLSKFYSGVYNYSAVYSGSKTYSRAICEGYFVVEDSFRDVKLFVNPLVKYYSGDERLIMYLTDDSYNPISNASLYISVNGVEYKRITDSDGMASMAINLNSGNYTVNVRFEGLGEYNAVSSDSNITVKPTVVGLNVTKIFRNNTQYHAIFSDNSGNLLKNASVRFNINGVFYIRVTNEFGVASLNINLKQGSYILTAENPITCERASNLITILPSIAENKDLTMYFRNGSQYVVKLLGFDGKAIAGEEVTFNINGVFYTRISDDEGYARLNINLNPGSYIITSEYNGCKVSNEIVVKPVLFTNDLSFRYGFRASFEATLVDGHGRYYPNQIITFNINGVIYERITDVNGVASLNIRLQAGRYIITSSFNGCNMANTITIY